MNSIIMRGVSRYYGDKKVLENINWSLPSAPGITAIIGRSGSGKTSFLNILGLIDQPSCGEIIIDDVSCDKQNTGTIERSRSEFFGFIFQNFCLIESIDVKGNVAMPLIYRGYAWGEANAIALATLERVGMLSHADNWPNILSGGEKQRVAIARAVASSPKVILADEPTGNLDAENSNIVIDIFKNIKTLGISTVMVTHDMQIANECDNIFSIKNGIINAI